MNNYTMNNNAINTTRSDNNDLPTTHNLTGSCAFEGCNCKAYRVIPTFSQKRGVSLCKEHSDNLLYNIEYYSSENLTFIGKHTEKNVSQSFEIESEKNNLESVVNMHINYKCKPTQDGSLDGNRTDLPIEWKTPIYRSNQAAIKMLGGIEALQKKGCINTLSDNCSAHIHTGIINEDDENKYDFTNIFANVYEYYQVFGGLYEYLDKMPNNIMVEYFGRGFTNYSRTLRLNGDGCYVLPLHENGRRLSSSCNKYLDADANLVGTGSFDCVQHYLTFNLQHSYSLEFRLPKFVNAKQYRKCILAMQDVTLALEKWYIIKKNSEKASEKMVKVFEKYFPY